MIEAYETGPWFDHRPAPSSRGQLMRRATAAGCVSALCQGSRTPRLRQLSNRGTPTPIGFGDLSRRSPRTSPARSLRGSSGLLPARSRVDARSSHGQKRRWHVSGERDQASPASACRADESEARGHEARIEPTFRALCPCLGWRTSFDFGQLPRPCPSFTRSRGTPALVYGQHDMPGQASTEAVRADTSCWSVRTACSTYLGPVS